MIDFLKVEQLVKLLNQQVAEGKIDQQTFENRLKDLVDVAEDGYYWMFGHKTEQWYRHDGQQWLPDSPGEVIVNLSADSKKNNPGPAHHAAPDNTIDWDTVDLGWFFVGLVLLGVVAAIVYSATISMS